MKTAEVSIATEPREFPAGTAFAGFRFRIVRQSDEQSAEQTVTVTTVQFAGLAAGRYRIEVAAVDGAGAALAAAVTTTLDVPADATVTIAVPAAVSVRLL